jgi:hypothetical protein
MSDLLKTNGLMVPGFHKDREKLIVVPLELRESLIQLLKYL